MHCSYRLIHVVDNQSCLQSICCIFRWPPAVWKIITSHFNIFWWCILIFLKLLKSYWSRQEKLKFSWTLSFTFVTYDARTEVYLWANWNLSSPGSPLAYLKSWDLWCAVHTHAPRNASLRQVMKVLAFSNTSLTQ